MWLGTNKHIRRKLEAEFGESLSISPDNNGKLLVVPDSLDIKNLSSQLMSIKKELDSLRENSSGLTQSVRKVAKLIRNELKTTHTEDLSWPPNPCSSTVTEVSLRLHRHKCARYRHCN